MIYSKGNYLLQLGIEHINSNVTCLGEQLANILESIHEPLAGYTWYCFDILYSTKEKELLFKKNNLPYCVFKTTEALINEVNKVVQFESGVFIAIQNDVNPNWEKHELPETEEDEGMQHPESLIEIRCFDTSYFEICGIDETIKSKLENFKYKSLD